jgi:uncharacterized protein
VQKQRILGRDILVDGYNVIKRAASFQATRTQSLEAARAQLITLLVNRYRHTPYQVTIVYDGDGAFEQTTHDRRICIIFSRHGETADSVIARLAAQAHTTGRDVEIYSDDIEVQQSVTLQGGTAQTTHQLERQVYAAPRDVERRTRHRVAMRRKYGLDSPYSSGDDDDDQPPRAPGKKKKKRH